MTPEQAQARQNLQSAIRECLAAEAFGNDEALMWFLLDCIAKARQERPRQQSQHAEPPESGDNLWA